MRHNAYLDEPAGAKPPPREFSKERYGWRDPGKPGEFTMLDKRLLQIDEDYQRGEKIVRVLRIAREFSWLAFGVVTVGRRANAAGGVSYFAIDGQHRMAAALRRDDIHALPCVVFDTSGMTEEAIAFLLINGSRNAPDAIDRFKAAVISEQPTAVFVARLLTDLGVRVTRGTHSSNSLRCIAAILNMADQDHHDCKTVLTAAAALCHSAPISNHLINGLWFIHRNAERGLDDSYVASRLRGVGEERLVLGAKRAAQLYVAGGARVWALGMLEEINKGVREHNRLKLREAVNG